jgi:hypothetical protein
VWFGPCEPHIYIAGRAGQTYRHSQPDDASAIPRAPSGVHRRRCQIYEDVLGTNSGLRTGELNLAILFRNIPVSVLRRL